MWRPGEVCAVAPTNEAREPGPPPPSPRCCPGHLRRHLRAIPRQLRAVSCPTRNVAFPPEIRVAGSPGPGPSPQARGGGCLPRVWAASRGRRGGRRARPRRQGAAAAARGSHSVSGGADSGPSRAGPALTPAGPGRAFCNPRPGRAGPGRAGEKGPGRGFGGYLARASATGTQGVLFQTKSRIFQPVGSCRTGGGRGGEAGDGARGYRRARDTKERLRPNAT